jgi:aerobic carbon-monoxide dehydrogenase medium subunit
MIPAAFDYECPRTLDEALSLLGTRDDAKILAGGHSLLPTMKLRLAAPALLVDLGRIAGLNQIRDAGDKIAIGAMTTHAEIAASDLLHRDSPLLGQAAREIGDVQVRNRGTIGGSLAQAHPSADYPAAILALDAEIMLASKRGIRTIAAREFFTGMFTTALEADEIITAISVPKTNGDGTAYKKFHHPASGYAVVGVAVLLKTTVAKIDSAAIGITGLSQNAYRATEVENALRGKGSDAIAQAAQHAADGVEPIGDTYASPDYRQHLARIMTRRALEEALGRKRGK